MTRKDGSFEARGPYLTMEDMQAKLAQFEQRNGMTSNEFYLQFCKGELGDQREFIMWAGLYHMAAHMRIRRAQR